MFPLVAVVPFILRHWMPFAFGAILLSLFTYHRCAVSDARESGRQEGRQGAREEIALQEDARVELLDKREQELTKLWEAQSSALDNQATALDQERKDLTKLQVDMAMNQQRSMQTFFRRLKDAGQQASQVPRADLVPVWDALLAEHRRRDADQDPRDDRSTQ